MVIEFPERFFPGALQTIWNNIDELNFGKEGASGREITVDMSNLKYTDAEGVNYIVLFPIFFDNMKFTVNIILPNSKNVISFVESFGILEYLYSNFNVFESGKKHPSVYDKTEKVTNVQNEFFSKTGLNYIIKQDNISNIFREEKNWRNLFSLNEILTKNCLQCVFELADNIFAHSKENAGCVTLQFRKSPHLKNKSHIGQLLLAVSDLGIGIEESFKHFHRNEIGDKSDKLKGWKILKYALEPGVSSTGLSLRGYGLHHVSKLSDILTISSGYGVYYLNNRKNINKGQKTKFIPGTSILITFDIYNENINNIKLKHTI